MDENAIQKFTNRTNIVIGSVISVATPILLLAIFANMSDAIGAGLLLGGILLGGFTADVLQGIYNKGSGWTDENGAQYQRWTDGEDTSGSFVPSEAVLPITAGVYAVLIFLGSPGIGTLITGLLGGGIVLVIVYLLNIPVLLFVTNPINRRRLKKAGETEFQQKKRQYRDAVQRVENEVSTSGITSEAIDELRSYKRACERVKSEYGIEETTYRIDERFNDLENQYKRETARDRITDLKTDIDKKIDKLDTYRTEDKYDRALSLLPQLEELLEEAEDTRSEYGFDVGFELSSSEIEQVQRDLIESKFTDYMNSVEQAKTKADNAVTNNNYTEARRRLETALRDVEEVQRLAEEWVFLSEQDGLRLQESIIPVYIKTIANQAADIEEKYKSPDGQKNASAKLNTLESAIEKLNELHQTTSQEANQKDIVTTAAKVQTVLLAGRLLEVEASAQQAFEKYEQQQYEQAKELFDSLVDDLDDIRERTPDEALGEYESELNTLQQACETNAERSRKQDLGLESGLQPESVDVIRASLRGGQAQFEAVQSGDTDVFTPGEGGSTNTNTEVFDPEEASGETGDTEVFDPD